VKLSQSLLYQKENIRVLLSSYLLMWIKKNLWVFIWLSVKLINGYFYR